MSWGQRRFLRHCKCQALPTCAVLVTAGAVAGALLLGYPMDAWAQLQYGQGFAEEAPRSGFGSRVGAFVIGAAIGGLIGAFFSDRLRAFRRFIILALIALAVLGAVWANSIMAGLVGASVGGVAAWWWLRDPPATSQRPRDTTLGSAEWATLEHLQAHGLIGGNGHAAAPGQGAAPGTATGQPSAANVAESTRQSPQSPSSAQGQWSGHRSGPGLFLGTFAAHGEAHRLHYSGDRHLLTIAPTRTGKGVSAIIPNLLTYPGSALVIDPKGENACLTAARRGQGHGSTPGLGQAVHVLDPWGITGLPVSSFNPLDWLISDIDNATENAMILAESLVPHKDTKADPFWDDEARALLVGLMLYMAFDDTSSAGANLGRVREIVVSGEEDLARVLASMLQSAHPVVRSTAARTIGKDEKLRANVFASLQSHTHFLDSPAVAESLSTSSFGFEALKRQPTTVYLVLPADRLAPFGRWLRLLVQQALTVCARSNVERPALPVLFLLDEMAALGRLSMVEQAFGLMAGFGMQLWGIVQDASQLKRIYDDGWETFIGNAGVIQYFGSRDQRTAEYFSKLCGVTTVEKLSLANTISKVFSIAKNEATSTSESTTTTRDVVQRQLAYPDELMVMKPNDALLLVENLNPIRGNKLRWFEDPERRGLGQPN